MADAGGGSGGGSGGGDKGGRRRAMSTFGEAFVHMGELGVAPNVFGVVSLKSRPQTNALVQCLEQLPKLNERFRSTYEKGKRDVRWVPLRSLDVERDVLRTVTLRGAPDTALNHFIAEHMPLDWEQGKPMWQVFLVDYEDDASKHDVVVRVSHTVGDGISLISHFLSITEPLTPHASAPPKQPSRAKKGGWWAALLFCLWFPFVLVVSLLRVVAIPCTLNDHMTPVKMTRKRLTKQRTFAKRQFSLGLVKDAAKHHNATVNDIVMAMLSAGLRRYMVGEGFTNLSSSTRVTAVGMINVRAARGLTPEKLRTPIPLSNSLGYAFLRFPMGDESMPERVRLVKRDMDWYKSSPEPVLEVALNTAIRGCVSSRLMSRFLMKMNSRFTLLVSNLAGPQEPLTLAGVEVVDLFNVINPMNYGLLCSVFSYNGRVTVAVGSDKGTVAEPDKLLQCFEDELAALGKKAE